MGGFDDALAEVGKSFEDDREQYVRDLLGEHRKAVLAFRRTEVVYAEVQAAYDKRHGAGALADQMTRNDVRAQAAASDGGWHRARADTFALSYLVERDVDDRKARR